MGKAKDEKYLFGKQILNLKDLRTVVEDSNLTFKEYLGFLDGCIRPSTGTDKTPTPEFRRGLFLALMGISSVDETTVSLSDEVESHMRQSTEVMYDDLKILAKKLDVKDVTINKWADDIAKAPCKEIVRFLDSDEDLFRTQLVSYLKDELNRRIDKRSSESDHWFQVFTCPVGTQKSEFLADYEEDDLSTNRILNVFARRFVAFLYDAVKEKAGSDSAFGQYLNSIIINYEKRFVPLGFAEARRFSDCYVEQDIHLDGCAKRVLLVGDSGCGKSMYLKKVLLDYANDGFKTRDDDAIVLPIYYELKGFGDSRFTNLTDVLMNMVYAQQVKKELVQSKFEQGKIILLLDAMDEIPLAKQKQFVVQLNNLMDRYGNLRIVISTRYGVSALEKLEKDYGYTKVRLSLGAFDFEDFLRKLGVREYQARRLSEQFSSEVTPAFCSIISSLCLNEEEIENLDFVSVMLAHFHSVYRIKMNDETAELKESLLHELSTLAHYLMVEKKRSLDMNGLISFCAQENLQFPVFYSESISNMQSMGIIELSGEGVLSFSHTIFQEFYLFVYYVYLLGNLPDDDNDKELILESVMKDLVMDWDDQAGSVRDDVVSVNERAERDLLEAANWLKEKANPWGCFYRGVHFRNKVLPFTWALTYRANVISVEENIADLEFAWKAGITLAGLELAHVYYQLKDLNDIHIKQCEKSGEEDHSNIVKKSYLYRLQREESGEEDCSNISMVRLMEAIGNPEYYLDEIVKEHGIDILRSYVKGMHEIEQEAANVYYIGLDGIMAYLVNEEPSPRDLILYGKVVYEQCFDAEKARDAFWKASGLGSAYTSYALLNYLLMCFCCKEATDVDLIMEKLMESDSFYSKPKAICLLFLGELCEKFESFEDSKRCFDLACSLDGDAEQFLKFRRALLSLDFDGARTAFDELNRHAPFKGLEADLALKSNGLLFNTSAPAIMASLFLAMHYGDGPIDKDMMMIYLGGSKLLVWRFFTLYYTGNCSLDGLKEIIAPEDLSDPLVLRVLEFYAKYRGVSTSELLEALKKR